MVCKILFRWTRQSLSQGCLVVQLKLDQLVIDVIDHRAQAVNTHGKKFCCPFMMDVAAVVQHAHFYNHGRIDRRDIGVAVFPIPVLRQTQSSQFSLTDFRIIPTFCMSCCYWIIMSIHSPNKTSLLSKEGGGVVDTPFIFMQFCVAHSILTIHHYPHVNEGSKRLRPGESTKGRGAPVEDNKYPSSSN